MKRTPLLLGFFIFILSASIPVAAKTYWLKCGKQLIYFDDISKTFSLKLRTKVYQGQATFYPEQINFSFVDNIMGTSTGPLMRYSYTISRENLIHTATISIKTPGITEYGSETDLEESGKSCIITKGPANKNKI